MKVIIPAALAGFNRKQDGSCSIRFATQELSKEDRSNLDDLFNRFGVLYFRDTEEPDLKDFEELDAIDIDLMDNNKSQSKRIQNVLWVWWDQLGRPGEFKEFYKIETEKIINGIKNNLVDGR